MNKHIKIVIGEMIFLVMAFFVIFMLYPRTAFELQGNSVAFRSMNANVIVISENPDFSNPRYIDVAEYENGNVSFNLKPGTYYWKPSNSFIQGIRKKFTINSEVGMKIDRKTNETAGSEENESELVNIGDVKINVTKTKEGITVGYIILEPDESEEIDDKPDEKYTGGEANEI